MNFVKISSYIGMDIWICHESFKFRRNFVNISEISSNVVQISSKFLKVRPNYVEISSTYPVSGSPSPVRLCRGCLRRFGDLRKNTPLEFWSMYLMCFAVFFCFLAWCAQWACLRRFADLRRNTPLEVWSMYPVCFVEFCCLWCLECHLVAIWSLFVGFGPNALTIGVSMLAHIISALLVLAKCLWELVSAS